MKKSLLAGVLVIVGACASGSIAQAGTVIPYPNAGTINPEVYTFTATATGNIVGYLYSANAADVQVDPLPRPQGRRRGQPRRPVF